MRGIAIALALLAAACSGEQPKGAAMIDAPAPAYEATALDGAPVTLASLRGQVVLLNVWATWCGPCREEIPYLSALSREEEAQGLKIIGVSIDTKADQPKVGDLAAQLGMPYAVWLDPDDRVSGLFRASGVPASMLIDRDGVLRWRHLGVVRETTPGFRDALERALAG